jgi:hypothetical protein
MEDKMEDKIAAAVSAALKQESEEKMASVFLRTFTDSLKTWCKPDAVEFGENMMGQRRLRAYKELPEPLPNAFGGETTYDVAARDVKYCSEEVLAAARQEEWGFYLLTPAECERAIRLLNQHLVLDVEDYNGVILGAFYSSWCLLSISNPEWNAKIEELRESSRRELAETLAKQYERLVEDAIKRASKVGITYLGVVSANPDEPNYTQFAFDVDGERFVIIGLELHNLSYIIHGWRENSRWYNAVIDQIHQARRGEIPFFRCGKFSITFQGDPNIPVPQNMMGHFIGRGGDGIRGMSEALGVRLRACPVADVPPDTGRVWRLTMPTKPDSIYLQRGAK